MFSAFIFFGGLADVFLSLMLWLILDNNISPDVFVHGSRAYQVREVPMARVSINNDCQEEIPESEPLESSSSIDVPFSDSSFISKRMIGQFFTQEEGPDRNWQIDE